MADYRRQLPPFLKVHAGQWVGHDYPAPGVMRHLAADGSECWTLRLHLPPGGMLSASSLRLLARWIREYALVGRRTSRQGFELVGVDPARLDQLKEEIGRAGFLPGGTGAALRQVKACVGFLHCQNALVDSPGLAHVLGEALLPLADLPAGLRVSVAGCPNDCGGAHGADVGLVGCYQGGPRIRVLAGARAGPDPQVGRERGALPARPPDYREVAAHVLDLVERWRAGARPGERLGAWLARTQGPGGGEARPAGEEARPAGGRAEGGAEAGRET